MCSYSMIADHYRDKFTSPNYFVNIPQQWPSHMPLENYVPKEQFDQLKRDVEEMKALLLKAKKYDADNGEPGCEMDEKVALIKKIAELVGVDLGASLPEPPKPEAA